MDTKELYFDYAAATPVDPQVVECMLPYFADCFYNPSAPYAAAREAKRAYEQARTRLARLLGTKPANLTITAGATEANNLAFATADGHVVTSAIEHDSVLACARAHGATLLGVDNEGFVSPEALDRAITPQTTLVSIALANGEIGTVQPMRAIGDVVKAHRARRLAAGDTTPLWLHTDASQAAGSRSLNVSSLCADLVTVSAAKIYGPKQVGLLYSANGIAIRPLILGGGQEGGARSGTENVAGAIGFAQALEIACGMRDEESRRLHELRDGLERKLLQRFAWARISGPRKRGKRLPGLLNISFPGLEARRLVILLDQAGVSVGTGSACAASKMKTSHVLQAIGLDERSAEGSLRISMGRHTTPEGVQRAAEAIIACVKRECARVGIDSADGTQLGENFTKGVS